MEGSPLAGKRVRAPAVSDRHDFRSTYTQHTHMCQQYADK